MELTEEDLKFEWECWGDAKPWYCPKCDSLLAFDSYQECDGTDPEMPKEEWKPHSTILAEKPVTFEEFCKIQTSWEKKRRKIGNE